MEGSCDPGSAKGLATARGSSRCALAQGMNLALNAARRAKLCGEVPVGACLMREEEVIALAYNNTERWANPLAHGEILALLQGKKRLRSKFLSQCCLYVTLQPCQMCAQAISACRLKAVYFGAYNPSLISPGDPWQDDVPFYGGIAEESCATLLSSFFQDLRKKNIPSPGKPSVSLN